MKRPLLLLVALLPLWLVAPPVSAQWAKPKPPTPRKNTAAVEGESVGDVVAATMAAVVAAVPKTVPQKLPYLLGAAVMASTDTLVHKFFNETHLVELKTEKGNYKRSLLYAGRRAKLLSVKFVHPPLLYTPKENCKVANFFFHFMFEWLSVRPFIK